MTVTSYMHVYAVLFHTMNMNGDQGLSRFLKVSLFLTQIYRMTLEDLKYSSQLLWTNYMILLLCCFPFLELNNL